MIGISGTGMQVRDLGHREETKQNEAQAHDGLQQLEPPGILPAEKCLRCRQILPRVLYCTKQRTFFDAKGAQWLRAGAWNGQSSDIQALDGSDEKATLGRFGSSKLCCHG